MITNFETLTENLTDQENNHISVLISILRKTSKNHQFKSNELVLIMGINHGIKTTGIRIRKMINHIRSSGSLPVIGTSKGYYISFDQDEIKKAIRSQEQRIRQQQMAVNGMKTFVL